MRARRLLAPLRWFQFTTRDLIWGVIVLAVALSQFSPRPLGIVATDRELDLAIMGKGYFILEQASSHLRGYVRHGKFTINSYGQLCFGRPLDGWIVQPQITLPQDHQRIEIAQDGTVQYYQLGSSQPQQAGQLQLAVFIGPEHLHETVPDIFLETQDSGCACIANPGGAAGAGLLRQGSLEYRPSQRMFNPQTALVTLALGIALLIFFELRGIRVQMVEQRAPGVVLSAGFADEAAARADPAEIAPRRLNLPVGNARR